MAPTDLTPEPEPLPPRIARLIEGERGELLVPTDWAQVEARMWRRIDPGAAGTPHWRRLVRSAAKAKVATLVPLAVGLGIGALGGVVLRDRLVQSAPAPSAAAAPLLSVAAPALAQPPAEPLPAPTALVVPTAMPSAGGDSPPAVAPSSSRSKGARPAAVGPRESPRHSVLTAPLVTPTPPAVTSTEVGSPYAEEQRLLERAGDALRAGSPADGYALAEEHARRFPQGALSEERELIAIRALKALQQKRRMVKRILEFHRQYPNSLLIPAVDALAPSVSGE